MNVQTLSIVVPAKCPNNCKFCVSKLHPDDKYTNQIETNKRFKKLYREDYLKRMEFARDNGCNTMIYTGDGEPLVNSKFLNECATWNRSIQSPFKWIEFQTSGINLLKDGDMNLRWLRNEIEVNTISLSLSDIFSDTKNAKYNGTPKKLVVDIEKTCHEIKRYDFNLRLSLNLTDYYNDYDVNDIFKRIKKLGANQVTFRKLYNMDNPKTLEEKEIDNWIKNHRADDMLITMINEYIQTKGRKLEVLPFGAVRYSVDGISTVIDSDCMNVATKESIKYLILRPDCKLYTKWDDEGSILF